jgi:superfamily I DNA and RNA helicase
MGIFEYLVYDNISIKVQEASENILDKIKQLKSIEPIYYYAGYPIFERNNEKTIIPIMIVSKKGLIVFYEDQADVENIDSFIMKLTTESLELKKIYKSRALIKFINVKNLGTFESKITNLKDIFDENQLKLMNSYLQSTYSMNRGDKRNIKNKQGLGNIIKEVNTRIATLDQEQFNSIYKDTEKHMRIRGLAGSGKTILMVRKMAYLHFKNPNLNMVYIFYTKSLIEFITSLFISFFRDLSSNKDPDFNKVKIVHSWGSRELDGFYLIISRHRDETPMTYRELRHYASPFEEACRLLLNTITEEKLHMFDYVFIDEAQDFGLNFFKLALKSLTTNGKLIYAYDELQMLDNTKSIPTVKEIFESVDENICKTLNLKNSYRCPSELLITAHALGLGIYHKFNKEYKIINMIEDLSVWEGVGYFVESGNLAYGKDVVLARIEDQDTKKALNGIDTIVPFSYVDKSVQYQEVAKEILNLIRNEDVLPKDIMIIDLDSINLHSNYQSLRSNFISLLQENEITDVNLVSKDSGKNFVRENEITYTTIFRAKGNEANIVFILNSGIKDEIYLSFSRNRLFTAMTRAKVRCYVCGVEINNIIEEIEEVKNNNYKLSFKYPTEKEMKNINKLSKKESDIAYKYNKALEDIKKLLKDENISKELLKDIKSIISSRGDKQDE